jgi:hypothetical protein
MNKRGISRGDSTDGGALEASSARLYQEVQRFRQWLFVVPIAIATVVIWWAFFKQVVFDDPTGEQPLPTWLAWVLAFVFGLGLPALGWSMRLITEVRPGLLWVRLSPFRGMRISTDEIDSAFTREYSAIREYGGWGVRAGRSGRAYNAYGDRGVQLVLTDGSRILVGSQRSEELMAALRLAGADIE